MDGLSLLRTTSWTLTQVGLEVSKVESNADVGVNAELQASGETAK